MIEGRCFSLKFHQCMMVQVIKLCGDKDEKGIAKPCHSSIVRVKTACRKNNSGNQLTPRPHRPLHFAFPAFPAVFARLLARWKSFA